MGCVAFCNVFYVTGTTNITYCFYAQKNITGGKMFSFYIWEEKPYNLCKNASEFKIQMLHILSYFSKAKLQL